MPDINNDRVEELLQNAGKRAPIPEESRRRMESVFRTELANSQRRHTRNRWAGGLAAAASVLMAVVLVNQGNEPIVRDVVASVSRDTGTVGWSYASSTGSLKAGNSIQQGDRVTTQSGIVSLQPLGSGLDIRLAENSQLNWVATNRIELEYGEVYVDADEDSEHFPITILADGLVIEHIGTQYQVRRDDDQVDVAVREGEIRITYNNLNISSKGSHNQGELTQFLNGSLIASTSIQPYGNRWSWASQLSPDIETDRMPVTEFLAWISDQTGYSVIYQDDPADSQISGSIDTMDAMEALDDLMMFTDFSFNVDDVQGTITVIAR